MLMLRFPDAEPFEPICTMRGGVPPRPCPSTEGELFLTIFRPGARLGVSYVLLLLVDLLKRGASPTRSCRGGDNGMGASASNACVTFENLIAGGGSSSESLSSTSKYFNGRASAEKPGL